MADENNPSPSEHVTPGSPAAPVTGRVPVEIIPSPPGLNGNGTLPEKAPTLATTPRPGFWKRLWQPAPAPVNNPQADGVREIVETVVFVVVLVNLLRAFAAEAFVIPTGSMAETLYGYQKIVTCPQCGIDFPVNCSSEVDPQEGQPSKVRGCTCPNCRYHIDFREEEMRNPGWHEPGWSSGDRVLVAKFLYDLFQRPPNRLDVVVFKYPGDQNFPRSGPFKNNVPMNYIKRLVGLPGETIAIHGGKLYTLAPNKGLKYDDVPKGAPEQEREQMQELLWQLPWMHGNDEAALQRFREGQFEIVRKPPEQVLSMKRLVFDNDHPAKDLKGPQSQHWEAEGGGWQSGKAHDFRSTPSGDQTDWLRYRHIVRGSDGPGLITDFMGYNSWEGAHRPPGENWASDLILECEAVVTRAQGELTLELSKGVDRFQAHWDLGTGLCSLYRVTLGEDKKQLLDSKPTSLKTPGTYHLRFANVDERLIVWVNSGLPFGDGVIYTPPEKLDPLVGNARVKLEGPTVDNDLEPASIGVKGADLAVEKLKLWRDTYYTTGRDGSPGDSDASFDPRNPSDWGGLRSLPVKTLYVQPGHFLCMGDNSPESSDGRSWGLVPERLMLGRALGVYWPVKRFGRIR